MIGWVLLAATGLPIVAGYAIGQPLEEARRVLPAGKSVTDWHLRCTGDAALPPGLAITPDEHRAGIVRCWVMEMVDGLERRTASPRLNSKLAEEELEFRNEILFRIKRRYSYVDSNSPERGITCVTTVTTEPDRAAAGESPTSGPCQRGF